MITKRLKGEQMKPSPEELTKLTQRMEERGKWQKGYEY
jgi:hypothetical protein